MGEWERGREGERERGREGERKGEKEKNRCEIIKNMFSLKDANGGTGVVVGACGMFNLSYFDNSKVNFKDTFK